MPAASTASTAAPRFGDEPVCCATRPLMSHYDPHLMHSLTRRLQTAPGVADTFALLRRLGVHSPQVQHIVLTLGEITLAQFLVGEEMLSPSEVVPASIFPVIGRELIDLLLLCPSGDAALWVQRTHGQGTTALAIEIIETLRRYIEPIEAILPHVSRLMRHIDAASDHWRLGDSGVQLISRLVIDITAMIGEDGGDVLEVEPSIGRIVLRAYSNVHAHAHAPGEIARVVETALPYSPGGALEMVADYFWALAEEERRQLWRCAVGALTAPAGRDVRDDPGAAAMALVHIMTHAHGVRIGDVLKSCVAGPAVSPDERAAARAILSGIRLQPTRLLGIRVHTLYRLGFWCARLGPDFQREAIEHGIIEFTARESLAFVRGKRVASGAKRY